jgi:DNA-binding NarL/FixJ family response regulator
MVEALTESGLVRPITDNHPGRPSRAFLDGAIERIRRDPLNIRVLEAMVFADTIWGAARAIELQTEYISVAVKTIRAEMGPSVRNSTAMVAFALDPETGLLDAESIFQKLKPKKTGKLATGDRIALVTLVARENWGKSEQELAAKLGRANTTEYAQQVDRICKAVGVANLMQLRVYELLRTRMPAEVDTDSRLQLSPQEVEVIELKALGLSNKEVAERLKVKVSVVEQCLVNAVELSGDSVLNSLLATLIRTDVIDRDRLGSNFAFQNYGKLDEMQIRVLKAMTAQKNLGRTLPDIAYGLQMSAASLSKILVKMYPILGIKDLQQLITFGLLLPDKIRNTPPSPNEIAEGEMEYKKPLSAREIEVADKAVGEELGITEHTVKNHVTNIIHAVRVNSGENVAMVDVILFLIDNGVLDRGKLIKDLDLDKERDELTDREKEALKVLVDNPNLTQELLADRMVPAIVQQTYTKYISSILHKFGFESYIQVVVCYHLLSEEKRLVLVTS